MKRHRVSLFVALFCLLASVLQPGCGSKKSKGEACQNNEECQADLKCLASRCGDGKEDSFCRTNSNCLTAEGYICEKDKCIKDPNFGKEPIAEEPTQDAAPEPTTEPAEEATQDASPPEPTPEPAQEPVNPNDGGSETIPEPKPEPATSSTCRRNSDCNAGQYCLIGADRLHAQCSPRPSACKSDKDCTTPGMYCRLFAFGASQNGLACVYPYDPGTPLKKPGESCQNGEECTSRFCLPHSKTCGAYCDKDDDCPTQYYCAAYGFFQQGEYKGCRPKCNADTDCPADYKCDTTTNACTVQNGKKVGSPCHSKSDCDQNQDCVDAWTGGTCTQACAATSKSCLQDTDCAADQECRTLDDQTKRCSPKCPTASSCISFAGGSAFCLADCTQDSDCRKDYYCGTIGTKKVCLVRGTKKLGEACTQASDCASGICRLFPSGHYCSEACTGTCPVGYSCNIYGSDRFCEKDCFASTDCAEGYSCLAQRCVISPTANNLPHGSACNSDSQCKGGRCLQDDSLFPHGYCSSPCGSCDTGHVCINLGATGSFCFKGCANDGACARKDYFCLFVQLVDDQQQPIPCSAGTACQTDPNLTFTVECKPNSDQSYCSTGICIGRGLAPTGARCNFPRDCRSGFCYQPPTNNAPTCQNDAGCTVGRCISGRCTEGGYCTEPCQSGGNSCTNNTACVELRNAKGETYGSQCTPMCRSDLQCIEKYDCKPTGTNTQKACLIK